MPVVELSVRAQDFLDKLDKDISERIKSRLRNLENNPVPSDSKFIGREDNEMIFRYRIGNFRVLYKVKKSMNIILVAKIDKRERVYD